MKYTIIAIVACSLLMPHFSYSQEKPLELSLGTIKTQLKQNAIDIGIKYIKSLDSLFTINDLIIASDRSLLQVTPEFNIQSGTNDAFSSIDLKITGLLMFFQRTVVAGLITPCTDCYMHLLPISVGVEANNTFTTMNSIIEVGYIPWYQSPAMKKVPASIKCTKIGLFLQAGYKFNADTTGIKTVGGQIDESEESIADKILRAKGSFAIDTKSLFELNSVGVGLVCSADGWYDFLNDQFYYAVKGTARFYLTQSKDKYFDLKYQKGSGAPNFNRGDQYGIGLTVTF
jgi:hypothetical protein